MSSIVLAGRSFRCGSKVLQSRLSPTTLRISRAVSLNSAIGRGLRKSKGVGFRGKERLQDGNDGGADEERPSSGGLVRRSAGQLLRGEQMTYDGWRKESTPLRQERRDELRSNTSTLRMRRGDRNTSEAEDLRHANSRQDRRASSSTSSMLRLRRGKKDIADNDERPKRRSRAGRFNDPEYSFGKRALQRRLARVEKVEGRGEEWDPLTRKLRLDDSRVTEGRRRPTMTPAASRAVESDRTALERNPRGSKLSKGRQAYLSRIGESSELKTSEENFGRTRSELPEGDQEYTRRDRDWSSASTESWSNRESRPTRDNDQVRLTTPRLVNDRLPLSIPYTTPASEFLYGTSVVEAALRSRCEPRRKLYKLYVYKGENSESGDGQDALERLAKKNNIPVVCHTDSPRLLDKMSGGRPHNGYILEASPLPKLPLTSLGSLTTDGIGFTINLDYQSREEAAINGTSPFITLPKSHNGQTRNPLVLFLDSILDPGNLGGIIRTASFLGITAIALSTRNSAPLSPVVLKASAGASENVTLFSVSKPAGFITDSKRAGWKVYAAVAPRAPSTPDPPKGFPSRHSMRHEANSRSGFASSSNDVSTSGAPAISTNDLLLSSPLDHDPCILMLGNEGEGLRWNLRSKADFELSIAGNDQNRGGVDSLNVSVAAGVLCQAFLSRVGEEGKGERKDGRDRREKMGWQAKRAGDGEREWERREEDWARKERTGGAGDEVVDGGGENKEVEDMF